MRIVLHIGTDKTGSTSIQQHLALNREWFRSRSIYIPDTGFRSYSGHGSMLRGPDNDLLKRLAPELKMAAGDGYETALLSGEAMCRYKAKQIRRLYAALSPHRVTVLVYLREQAELLQSGHLQNLKQQTNTYGISLFEEPASLLEKLHSKRIRAHPGRNYYRMLRKWEKNIPHCDFNVRIFSRELVRKGDVVADFIDQIGLGLDDTFENTGVRQNPSLDVESGMVVEAWQAESKSQKEIERLTDIARSIISDEGRASKYFLSRATVESVRAGFRPHNKKLARHFMGLESDPFQDAGDCWRETDISSLRSRAQTRSRKILQIDETPTLSRVVQADAIAALVQRCEGWSTPANWGVWSLGPVSRVKFRVPYAWVSRGCKAVRIIIRGKYYGENSKTAVKINAIDYGSQNLGSGKTAFILPAGELRRYETVEITLTHTRPVSPKDREGSDDHRPIAFGLQTLGCVRLDAIQGQTGAARNK